MVSCRRIYGTNIVIAFVKLRAQNAVLKKAVIEGQDSQKTLEVIHFSYMYIGIFYNKLICCM